MTYTDHITRQLLKPQDTPSRVKIWTHQGMETTGTETLIVEGPFGLLLAMLSYRQQGAESELVDVSGELHDPVTSHLQPDALGQPKLHTNGGVMYLSPKQTAQTLFVFRRTAQKEGARKVARQCNDTGLKVRQYYDKQQARRQQNALNPAPARGNALHL